MGSKRLTRSKFPLKSVFMLWFFMCINQEGAFFSSLQDVKVGISCGGGSSDTNISADLVQLVSKLCRLSVPLSKQSAPKSSQQRRYHGSDSIPALVSWDSMQSNSGMPYQDFPIIGRQNSLKLLAERCSNGPTPVYEMPKPRKIRDPEPYQHFYKPISKTIDQKLRYVLVLVTFRKLADVQVLQLVTSLNRIDGVSNLIGIHF